MRDFPFNYPISEHEILITNYFNDRGGFGINSKSPITRSIIICFLNRSGSNFLAECLQQSGGIGPFGEFFNHPNLVSLCKEKDIDTLSDYVFYINSLMKKDNVFCTKLGWAQLYFLIKIGVIPKIIKNPKFIFITRNDLLGQAISFSIASQTKKWSSEHKAEKQHVEYSENDILNGIIGSSFGNARFEQLFSLYRIKPISVRYEGLSNNPEKVIMRVLNTLNYLYTPLKLDEINIKKQGNETNTKFKKIIGKSFKL